MSRLVVLGPSLLPWGRDLALTELATPPTNPRGSKASMPLPAPRPQQLLQWDIDGCWTTSLGTYPLLTGRWAHQPPRCVSHAHTTLCHQLHTPEGMGGDAVFAPLQHCTTALFIVACLSPSPAQPSSHTTFPAHRASTDCCTTSA